MGKKNKSKGRRKASNDEEQAANVVAEYRFDTQNKPQFRSLASASSQNNNNNNAKVAIDDRFASVLTDPRFQLDIRDKYGRKERKTTKKNKKKKGHQTSDQKNHLEAFYSVETNLKSTEHDEEEEEEDDNNKEDAVDKPTDQVQEKDIRSGDDDEEEDLDQDPASRIAYLTALSRGELDVSSSSDEEEEEDDEASHEQGDHENEDSEDDKEDLVLGKAGILDPSFQREEQDEEAQEEELTFEPSRHLAICNLDWSHVRAVDIFAICNSFTPAGGVQQVQVYVSDFGQERMAKEEEFGPSNLWKKNKKNKQQAQEKADSDEEEGDGSSGSEEDAMVKEDDADNEDIEAAHGGEEEEDYEEDYPLENFVAQEDHVESDFDPEKLRAYEASRLRYYFAVVTFADESHADVCYKEVDGMEFENSSAAIDVRAIPPSQLDSVVHDRPLRDQADGLPSNYVPPNFVVNALQQTNVKCTWEAGDADRERALTKYSTSGQDWKALAESDDLRAYLGSDVSSDEEEKAADEADSDGDEENGARGKKKSSRMRQLLGLDNDDDEDGDNEKNDEHSHESDEKDKAHAADEDSSAAAMSSDDDDDDDDDEKEVPMKHETEGDLDKQTRYIPGAKDLAEKIRSKVDQSSSLSTELTPWEKYQQKRKEKRKEKKQQARERREEVNESRRGSGSSKNKKKAADKSSSSSFLVEEDEAPANKQQVIGKEELELLVAGDDKDEEARDYDMRGLQRLEKNKDKKLRGSRKRKEDEFSKQVTGTDFEMDLKDDRFKALLDGQDDRFGIDRTDANFKDTPAMQQVMAEQSRRRRKNKKRRKDNKLSETKPYPSDSQVVPDAIAGSKTVGDSKGASALSSLVSRLKSKVQ